MTSGRWGRFTRRRTSCAGLVLFAILCLFSFTAEIWSNSKPVAIRTRGRWYFPVLARYHPSEFGVTDAVVTDYRALKLEEGAIEIWPLNRWDPYESNQEVASYPSGPTRANLLGTDDRGRDLFARILYGFRYSIGYAFLVWFISSVLAIVLGGAMGFAGGWVDLVGQRLVEIWNTIPVMFLLIILVAIFNPTLLLLVVITSVFGWMNMSYYVRAEFLRNRKSDFVEAARALGCSPARIFLRHVLPNSITPLITFAPFVIAGHVYGLAALDYLGFGLSAPTPSWGELLNQAEKHFTTAWWLAVYPSLGLFVVLVLLTVIGDGIRVAFAAREK